MLPPFPKSCCPSFVCVDTHSFLTPHWFALLLRMLGSPVIHFRLDSLVCVVENLVSLCTSVRNLAEFCWRTCDAEEKMEVSELDGLPCGSQAPGLCTNPALGNSQGLSLGSPVHRYLKHAIWHWKILLAFIVSKVLIWEKNEKRRLGFQGCRSVERSSFPSVCHLPEQCAVLWHKSKNTVSVFVAVTFFFNLQGEKIIGHLFLAIFLWDLVSIKTFL